MTKTFSSDVPVECGLDTMLLVYSLLEDHPASAACEQFLRSGAGWFTTILTLLETRAVLTKVYGVDAVAVSNKIAELTAGPITVLGLDATSILAVRYLAESLGIDVTDASVVYVVQAHKAKHVATDDMALARACANVGIAVENPIDTELRLRIAECERENLPVKGLPRMLRQVYEWSGRCMSGPAGV